MHVRLMLQIFLRTYLIGATFNTKGMQNVGLAYVMDPGLTALYAANSFALQHARARYLKHYNTHPFWTPLVAGIFLNTEKQRAQGILPARTQDGLKETIVCSLSAIGDSFFDGSFLVMWSLISANVAVAGWIGTLVAWIVVCLVGLQLFKFYTFVRGYTQGPVFINTFKSWGLINWGLHIKLINAFLVALFFFQVAPGGAWQTLLWVLGAGVLGFLARPRTWIRTVLLAFLVLAALVMPTTFLTMLSW